MPPFLSILIPTRNRAAYLKYAIQSALNIPADDIEIIVSENFSSDNSLEVCNSFSDPRLKVIRPESPLPMHENWELLLRESRGEWVTFVGDDDAVMKHCVSHLKYLCDKYPRAEAVVSSKAYYFWDGTQKAYGGQSASFIFTLGAVWRDSKKQLQQCLDGILDYRSLPQMYSGGFQRRSLINRIFRAQNGQYFRSVTPDAYSALMAGIFTYRYLETGVPMVWGGTSPHRALQSVQDSHKDRKKDFFGMHCEESLTLNKTLGDFEFFTMPLVFYESYISAFPLTPYSELSMDRVRSFYLGAVIKFRTEGNEVAIERLAEELGFQVPSRMSYFYRRIVGKLSRIFKRIRAFRFTKGSGKLTRVVDNYSSHSHQDHPDILSCDSLLARSYMHWLEISKDG